ncbi:hypothetical protein [Streptomyces sp.]|uniref:hypothetical protein n=1 Tax=Streptomyces sp. TaxID=1931 RepID=UPI002F952434
MPFTALPWDGAGNKANEAEWRKMWAVEGDRCLKVGSLTFSASNRDVTWSGAVVLVQGAIGIQSGTDSVTIPLPGGSNKNICYGLVEYDPDANGLTYIVKAGGAAVNPVSPGIDQNENGTWHMPVWRTGPNGTGTAASLEHVDLRRQPSRQFYAPTAEMRYVLGLTATKGDVAYDDDGSWVWNGTSWKFLGSVQIESGVILGTNFNASGAAVVTHGLGWEPEHMDFTAYVPGGADGVAVYPSSTGSPFTTTTATIVAKVMSTGAPYDDTVTKIGWVAYRHR